ncbi:MAG: hypothetical protein ACO3AW_08355 [Chitinophagaceae bacterium]
MLSSIKNIFVFKFFWIITCIQILNISVDPPDGHTDSIAENLTVNEMESIVEIFLEKVLNIDNAIVEQDEPDDEAGNSISKTSIDLFLISFNSAQIKKELHYSNRNNIHFSDSFYDQFTPENLTPPPQA